jgi:hypothetical protein
MECQAFQFNQVHKACILLDTKVSYSPSLDYFERKPTAVSGATHEAKAEEEYARSEANAARAKADVAEIHANRVGHHLDLATQANSHVQSELRDTRAAALSTALARDKAEQRLHTAHATVIRTEAALNLASKALPRMRQKYHEGTPEYVAAEDDVRRKTEAAASARKAVVAAEQRLTDADDAARHAASQEGRALDKAASTELEQEVSAKVHDLAVADVQAAKRVVAAAEEKFWAARDATREAAKDEETADKEQVALIEAERLRGTHQGENVPGFQLTYTGGDGDKRRFQVPGETSPLALASGLNVGQVSLQECSARCLSRPLCKGFFQRSDTECIVMDDLGTRQTFVQGLSYTRLSAGANITCQVKY